MAVVNNSGLNYTLYYNVLEYFKTIMSNHPSIAQVSVGDVFQFDDIEFPYYPIGNVLITETTFTTNTTEYSVQLLVADKIKLKNNDSSGSANYQVVPFFGVDDTVDIHANTLAIINDLTSYTQRSQQAFQINSDITATPFKDRFDNGLAGWVVTFTLTTHNDKNMCLFDLNPTGSTTTTTRGPSTTTTTSTTTTSTTTTSTTSTTTTAAPGTCVTSEFAVLRQSDGTFQWATKAEACAALAGGGLSTQFGNMWLSGTALNSSTGCLHTNGGQYPLWNNQALTTPFTYSFTQPYVIMLNLQYGTSLNDGYVVRVDKIGGQDYITEQTC